METREFVLVSGYGYMRCACGTNKVPISAVVSADEGKASAVPADWVNDYILKRLDRDHQLIIDVFICTECHKRLVLVGKLSPPNGLSLSLVVCDLNVILGEIQDAIFLGVAHFPRCIAKLVAEFMVPVLDTFSPGLPITLNDWEVYEHALTRDIFPEDGIFSISGCRTHDNVTPTLTLEHLDPSLPFERPVNLDKSRIISVDQTRCDNDVMTFYIYTNSDGSVFICETAESSCEREEI